jgi:hypothetical protein
LGIDFSDPALSEAALARLYKSRKPASLDRQHQITRDDLVVISLDFHFEPMREYLTKLFLYHVGQDKGLLDEKRNVLDEERWQALVADKSQNERVFIKVILPMLAYLLAHLPEAFDYLFDHYVSASAEFANYAGGYRKEFPVHSELLDDLRKTIDRRITEQRRGPKFQETDAQFRAKLLRAGKAQKKENKKKDKGRQQVTLQQVADRLGKKRITLKKAVERRKWKWKELVAQF